MKLPIINLSKKSFFLLAAITFGVMLILSLSAGSSGDEYFHVDFSEHTFNFYKTFSKDTSAVNPPSDKEALKYYGQSLDTQIHIFNKLFGIKDIYTSRHVINSIIGWLIIFLGGLVAATVFSWEAGIITILFLFFSPKLIGHSWNNLKDPPFAAAYMFALYAITKILTELPQIKRTSIILFILGSAWALSLRIGGLIVFPYLFLFTGIYYITHKIFYTKKGFIEALKTVGVFILISLAGYLLGLIFWPYGLSNPLKNPFEALTKMTDFQMFINQLFEGQIIQSNHFPWYYGIKYMIISTPLIIHLGVILFFLALPFRKDIKKNYLLFSLLLFAFAFPIAYTIYKHSNLYGGWRHLLWTYSPIVILAAGGFDYFLKKENKYIKYGTIAVIAVLLFHPVKHTFKNHPFEYVYYNQLVGGVKGAYGQYEMDYYYHSLRAGVDWFIKNELSEDTVIVATNHSRITGYYFRNYPQVKVHYCRFYEKGKNDWDYAIWANTHITPLQLEKGYWPPKKAIHTMDVDGVPIGAVIKRVSKEDLKGFDALKKRKVAEAKQHFKNFLQVYPENEEVLEGYARTLLMERKLDSVIVYADSSLTYNPRQLGALVLKASALNTQKKYKEALACTDKMIEIKDDFAEAHFHRGQALKHLNQPNEAIKEFQIATRHKKEFYQAFMQIGEILINYKQYKKALSIYNQVLKFKKSDLYTTALSAKCHHLLNDNKKAEELLNSLPARNQNNLEVIKVRCRIAMSKNDMQSAGRYLNMARRINNNADLYVLRAMYVLKQNQKEQARQLLVKAKELDPINREAQELLKTITTNQPAAQKPAAKKETETQPQSIMFQKPKEKKQTSPFKVPAK